MGANRLIIDYVQNKRREVVMFGWRSKSNKCRTCLSGLPKRHEVQRNSREIWRDHKYSKILEDQIQMVKG